MTFCETLRQKIEETRSAKGLVEYTLNNPKEEVIDAITAAGGRVLRSGYTKTCHSDTCAHNSHDPGYRWTAVEVPQAWLDERPDGSLFDFDDEDDEYGIMLIPSKPPVAVYNHSCGAFADWSGLAELRPYAAEALNV